MHIRYVAIVAVMVISVIASIFVFIQPLTTREPESNIGLLEITNASIDSSLFWFNVDIRNNHEQASLPQFAIELENLLLYNETKDLITQHYIRHNLQGEFTFQSKKLSTTEENPVLSWQYPVEQIFTEGKKNYCVPVDPFFKEGGTYYVQVNGIEHYNNTRVWSNIYKVVAPKHEPIPIPERPIADWVVVHDVHCQLYPDGSQQMHVTIETLKEVTLNVDQYEIFDKKTGVRLGYNPKSMLPFVLRQDRVYLLRARLYKYPQEEDDWSNLVEFTVDADFVEAGLIDHSWHQVGIESELHVRIEFLSINTANISKVLVSDYYEGEYKEYPFEESGTGRIRNVIVYFGTDHYDRVDVKFISDAGEDVCGLGTSMPAP